MINPYSIKSLKSLIESLDIRPQKSKGQNFLISEESANKIVDFSLTTKDDDVIEIGPGFLSLTLPLSKKAKSVNCIEIDRKLFDIYKKIDLPENVKIINKDFLELDLKEFFFGKKLTVFSNLPYSISSQVLVKLFLNSKIMETATLSFQKELAQRIISGPSSKNYGTLSVQSALLCDIESGPLISSDSFYPKPEVQTLTLRFKFREKPLIKPEHLKPFSDFLKRIFQYRRKKIPNNLKNALCLPSEKIKSLLEKSRIDPDKRIENIEPSEIYKLFLSVNKEPELPKSLRA